MQPKQFNAILTSYAPRADKSFRISFVTNELGLEGLKEIHELYQKYVWVVIAEHELTHKDLESLPPCPTQKPDGGEKSPSQRLRACLYRLWEAIEKQHGPAYAGTFEKFYESYIEEQIADIKKDLNGV